MRKRVLFGMHDNQEVTKDMFGIPVDAAVAQAAFRSGEIKAGEVEGGYVDAFSITVKDKDEKTGEEVTYYSTGGEKVQPFGYAQIAGLAQAFPKMGDDAIGLLGEVLKGSEVEVTSLVDLINANLRETAKAAAYASIVSKFKPEDAETREKREQKTIAQLASAWGCSFDEAKSVYLSRKK